MSEPVRNNSIVGLLNAGNRSEQLSPFYTVNVDCWEKIFEFLSIKDIFAMSKTCKRMRQICGYYLSEYLPGACYIGRDVIGYTSFGDDLSQFIRKIRIDLTYDNFQHVLKAESYCSLETIVLRGGISDTQIDMIKDVLKIVENIELQQCKICGDIHEKFFKFCSKVKQLIISEPWDQESPEEEFEQFRRLFFQQTFSSLEYFGYSYNHMPPERSEILTFLERNPNVKHLGIDLNHLWLTRDSFINSNIRLDSLNVHYHSNVSSMHEFVNLLQSLHTNGFYKTLSIVHLDDFADESMTELSNLRALESFSTDQGVDLSEMIHLKEVCISIDHMWYDIKLWANPLVNLEKFVISSASTDEILPFFRHSKHLKTVKVKELDGPLIKNGALDLLVLNMERLKLGATQRVTIHVSEDIYLATKMKGIYSNLRHVEITRFESESLNQKEKYINLIW